MALMRLFFAVPVNGRAAAELEALRAGMATPAGGYWLAPRDWHMTLAFLGDTDGTRLPALCELGEQVAAQAVQSVQALSSLQWWPSSERARLLVAAGEVTPSLKFLRKELSAGLRAIGVGYDSKPLHPHVTLLRMQRDAVVQDLSVPACAIAVDVQSVALYRSERERGVTHYRPLWQRDLPEF